MSFNNSRFGATRRPAGDKKQADIMQRMAELQLKLDQIASYIAATARANNVPVKRVPCPNVQEWRRLSLGGGAVLPSAATLLMSGNGAVREIAKELGCSMLEAWFEAARRQLLARIAKEAANNAQKPPGGS